MTATDPGRRPHPAAQRVDDADEFDGERIPDPYRWLEDPSDPRTQQWTAAQHALFTEERATWTQAAAWQSLLTSVSSVAVALAPVVRGDRVFFRRRDPGAEHAVLYVRDAAGERVLLDPTVLDPTCATVLESWHPSLEGDLLAYQLSVGGVEDSALYVMDVLTGKVLDGPIDRVRRSSVAWLPGGRSFYFIRRLAPHLVPGEERYHRRVYLHTIGQHPNEDALIFGDGRDKTQFYTVGVSADGRWFTVSATAGADPGTDVWIADLAAGPPDRPPLRAVHEGAGARSRLDLQPDRAPQDPLLLLTDLDAPRGRIVATTAADPGPDTWRDVIPQRPDAVLEDFAVLRGTDPARRLGLVLWRRHAVSELTVHDLADGAQVGTVTLPGRGTVRGLAVTPGGGTEALFCYSDFTTAPMILRYDVLSGQVAPWPVSPAAHAAGPGAQCVQAEFTSRDGTTVRMFVVSPNGRPDRPRPAVLTGYGGFGVSNAPGYMPHVLAWVRSGGVYAIACLRGGGEEGEQWHRAGRGRNKQNVFDDFAAAADHLAEAGWTTPDRLGVVGGSNGGLLVCAALTQYPEKIAGAVAMDPLTDMIRYERFGLGPSWSGEYGSVDDPLDRAALLAYSPYHRVADADADTDGVHFPPTLLTAAEADTRVDPLHARKMCAALQYSSSSSQSPVLLRMEMGVGHGARAISRTDALFADALTFLGLHLGLSLGVHLGLDPEATE